MAFSVDYMQGRGGELRGKGRELRWQRLGKRDAFDDPVIGMKVQPLDARDDFPVPDRHDVHVAIGVWLAVRRPTVTVDTCEDP